MGSARDSTFRRHLGLALIAALLVRLALAFVPVDPFQNPDSHAFRQLALSLATRGQLVYADEGVPGQPLVAFRSLLYPVFLVPFVGPGEALDTTRVALVQGALGLLVVLGLALLARRAYGARVGIVTAWIGALYASSVLFERQVASEALYTPLLVAGTFGAAATWGAGDGARPRGTARAAAMAALAGLVLGLAALTRPAGVAAAAAVGLVGALVRRGAAPRASLALVAAFVAGFALALAPALLRNQARLGAPVLLTSGGMNIWIGNGRGTVGEAWAVMARLLPTRGELGMDRWFYADTWAHGGEILRSLPGLLWTKLRGFGTPLTRDPWFVPYRLVWPFAFAGLVWARRAPAGEGEAPARALLVAVFVSQVVVALVTVSWSRYRAPLEPFLWALAALGLVALWRGGRGTRRLAYGLVAGNALLFALQAAR